jgi:hypothetical protein
MKEEVEAVVEPFALRGNRGTPISYEDIVPWRDVVFLRWDQPYDEEDQSRGAPVSGTFCYTGYLREKRGRDFVFTYFSNVVADGHLPAMKGTGILFDGGANRNCMKYDPSTMKFWKTGEQCASGRSQSAIRSVCKHERCGNPAATIEVYDNHQSNVGTFNVHDYCSLECFVCELHHAVRFVRQDGIERMKTIIRRIKD